MTASSAPAFAIWRPPEISEDVKLRTNWNTVLLWNDKNRCHLFRDAWFFLCFRFSCICDFAL